MIHFLFICIYIFIGLIAIIVASVIVKFEHPDNYCGEDVLFSFLVGVFWPLATIIGIGILFAFSFERYLTKITNFIYKLIKNTRNI